MAASTSILLTTKNRKASCASCVRQIRWLFLAEQAGGKASDGKGRILEKQPDRLHARTPLFIGSANDVTAVERIYARYAQG